MTKYIMTAAKIVVNPRHGCVYHVAISTALGELNKISQMSNVTATNGYAKGTTIAAQ
jgi:hypothetical protein